MTLKRQLLLASALMLLIPWAGLQFVLELDRALRSQAADQLDSQASRIAQGLAPRLPRADGREVLYAGPLERSLNLDGYGDDWPGYEDAESRPAAERHDLDWQLAVDERHLYALIRVRNAHARFFDPGQPELAHDFLRLYWREGRDVLERQVRTPAPGPVIGQQPGLTPRPDYRVSGYWQATGAGYQVELRMPRPVGSQGFGFEVVRVKGAGDTAVSGPGGPPDLPQLVTRIPAAEQQLAEVLFPGQRALVLSPDGWVLASQAISASDRVPDFDRLNALEILERITLNGLRALVRHFQPEPTALPEIGERLDPDLFQARGLVRHGSEPTHLASLVPLPGQGLLVLEQSLARQLALSGDALGAVISRSVLLVLGLTLALLGYASWLSWRITRLQRSVRASVDGDGRVVASLPASRARDELGELSRQFSQMVDNLQGYTRYLESFARRLSHELKTPVAVVRSSLDNLAQPGASAGQQAAYRQRAQQATDRLSSILQGMSEAARLEQSFDRAETEVFDLAAVAAEATGAYQALAKDHEVRYIGPDSGVTLRGSPELMVQLLDKLVDNARDFTPAGERIEIRLEAGETDAELAVFNRGSSLPSHLTSEIFNPFVSLREGTSEGHLGQGLMIVRLIAEFHGGRVTAQNLPDQGGVIFRVRLPRR